MQAQQARRFQTQNGPTPDDKGWGTSYNLSNCPLWLKNEPDAVAVYVVAPENGHPCKIGHSRNCEKRRDSIQTPHWIELFVHGVIWLPTKKQAARVEREVHKFLNKRNKLLRGEWYDIRNSEAYRVVEATIKALDYDTMPIIQDWSRQFISDMDRHEKRIKKLADTLGD